MHDSAGRRPDAVVRELYEQVFGAEPSAGADGAAGGGQGEA
jgi:hypothetical protein